MKVDKSKWKKVKLGEVCEIARGGSPRPINNYLTDDKNSFNWIKIGDAVEGSKYICSTKQKIKKEGLKKTRYVKAGDFLLTNSMSFGHPYILKIDGCIHDGWLVISDTNNIFDKEFLYYLLDNPMMYSQFASMAFGAVVRNLNTEVVKNVTVCYPPLYEQQAIAKELDSIQSMIGKCREQLEDYDRLARSIFHEMFGDPVNNEKGWEVKKLGEVCKVISGSTPKTKIKENWCDTGHLWVTPAELGDTKYMGSTKRNITDFALQHTNLTAMPIGTVLLSSRAPIGKLAITTEVMYCNQGFKNLVCSEQIINEFLYSYLSTQTERLNYLGNGVTFKEISKSIVSDFPIPLPPLPLQQQFAVRIEAIEKMKEATKKQLADLQQLFDSRMQYYFS